MARPAREGRGTARLPDRRSAQFHRQDGTIKLTEEQAKAILDIRLQRLTAISGKRYENGRTPAVS